VYPLGKLVCARDCTFGQAFLVVPDRATLGESLQCCVASSRAAEECNGASVRSYRAWILLISWRVLHGIIESFIRVARESPSRWRVHQFVETLNPDLNAEASSSLVRLPDRLALRVILESPKVFPERRLFSLILENRLKSAAGHRTCECCAVMRVSRSLNRMGPFTNEADER
jgi:hypothetical protein